MTKRALSLFCVLTYALSWSFQFVAIAKYGNPENPRALPWLVPVMLSPALITLGFAAFSRRARAAVAWRPAWRMLPLLPVAVAVPTIIAFLIVAIETAVGWGKPGWFAFSQTGVAISGGPWLLGGGAQNWWMFGANVALTGAYFAVLNALPAAGEELGWRGFLQGELVARLGIARGIGLLGLIWSFWHLPVLLAGYNFPQHPVLGGFVLFPLELIGASFFLGWLTLRAGSFWPAAIAHGATNSIEEGVIANIHLAVPQIYQDLLRLAATVAVGLVCWALLGRRPAARPMPA